MICRPDPFWRWWLVAAVWLPLAFVNLWWGAYPSMDSWCYFAPSAASRPFTIITPLLGDWAGSSTGWGLHWPGGALILSSVLGLLPREPWIYVGTLLLEWFVLANLVRFLVRRLLSRPLWGDVAGALILFDRAVFNIAWLQRHEIIALVAEAALLACLVPVARQRHGFRTLIVLFVAGVTMAAVHPSALGAGAAVLVLLGGLTAFARWPGWRPVLAFAAGWMSGVIGVFTYFATDSNRLAAFLDHARVNLGLTFGAGAHFFFGKTLLVNFPEMYRPLYSGWLLIAALVAGTILTVRTFLALRARSGWRAAARNEASWLCILVLGWGQAVLNFSTYNGYYMVLLVPFAIILGCRCLDRIPGQCWTVSLTALCLVVALFHAALWPVRIGVWLRQGCPLYRSVLKEVWTTLPPSRTVLIPEVLWEEALRQPRHAFLNTLPNNASNQRRRDYESYVRRQIRPGDILIHDRLQSQPVALLSDPGLRWRLLDTRERFVTRGPRRLGFQLDLYHLDTVIP